MQTSCCLHIPFKGLNPVLPLLTMGKGHPCQRAQGIQGKLCSGMAILENQKRGRWVPARNHRHHHGLLVCDGDVPFEDVLTCAVRVSFLGEPEPCFGSFFGRETQQIHPWLALPQCFELNEISFPLIGWSTLVV